MPRHMRQRAGFGGGVRQRTSWNRTVSTAQVTVPAASKVLVATVPTEAFAEESTIRRTIMQLHVNTDQSAASETQIGAVGMHVANDNAIAAGVGSLLGPVTDADDEAWFLWAPIAQVFSVITAVGIIDPSGQLYHIDSKAQRRVQLGQSAVVVVENSHAAFGMNVIVNFSLLVGFGLKRR